MDQPVAGPVDAPRATPSNFAEVASARGAQADANGGLYQPNAGGQPNVGWGQQQSSQQPGEQARLTDFQYDNELAVPPERGMVRKPQDGVPVEGQNEAIENAPHEAGPESEIEQLFDEAGEPIDMVAYNQQRQQIMTAMQQALDTGKLPAELLKQMCLEVEVNGEKREVTLEEARGGYMRRAAYTRELEKAHGLQADAQNMLQLERLRNEEWKDPRQLRAGLRMLGLEQSFMRAAFGWAEERVTYMKMSPDMRQMYDRNQQLEMERENFAQQQRQWQQQQQMQQRQQQGPDPSTLHIQKQLEQLMPRVFKMHQIGSYPLAQQTFIQQLSAYCPDGVVTAERANEAALATKEFLADLDKIRAEQTQISNQHSPGNGQAQRWLGPRRLSAGPRPNMAMPMGNVLQQSPQGAGQRGGRRPSDFVRRMGLG